MDRKVRTATGHDPTRAQSPGSSLQRDLQHRRIDDVERRAGSLIAARGKCRRVDDHIGRDFRDRIAAASHRFPRSFRLVANRPMAACLTGQFGYHAIDRIGIGSREDGAIEHDQHDRRAIG